VQSWRLGSDSKFHVPRAILSELQCDAFQGYLFGGPVPAAEITGQFLVNEPSKARATCVGSY
jgi:hypothetical protein